MTGSRRFGRSARLMSAVLAIGAILLPGVSTAAAAATVDPAASLPLVACGQGGKLVMPSSSSTEANGWLRIDYNFNGIHSWQELPPAGFDFSQASNDNLARAGLPARPQAVVDQDAWTAQMKKAYVPRIRGLCEGTATFGSSYYADGNNSWGGDQYYYSGGYDGVKAVVTEATPSVSCGNTSALGQWVGIGGVSNDSAFLQTGTAIFGPGDTASAGEVAYTYNNVTYHMGTWWELIYPYQANPPVYQGLAPRPGDLVLLQVSATAAYSNTFMVQDYDQTAGWSFTTYVSIGVTSMDHAEFIDERPKSSGVTTPLLNYGWTTWQSMAVRHLAATTWVGAYAEGSAQTEQWRMMTSDGLLLHLTGKNPDRELSNTTGSFSDNHMQDHFHNCQ
jgi:Peptidase A4 family